MIEDPSKLLVDSAIEGMTPEVRNLLHAFHTEDHENVYVPIFSDDEGITRIVWGELRQNAKRAFLLVTTSELKGGLANARATGQSVVYWGIDDLVGNPRRSMLQGQR